MCLLHLHRRAKSLLRKGMTLTMTFRKRFTSDSKERVVQHQAVIDKLEYIFVDMTNIDVRNQIGILEDFTVCIWYVMYEILFLSTRSRNMKLGNVSRCEQSCNLVERIHKK